MFETEPQGKPVAPAQGQPTVATMWRAELPRMSSASPADFRSRITVDIGRRTDIQTSVPSSPIGSQGPPIAPAAKPRPMQWAFSSGVPFARRDTPTDSLGRPGPQRLPSRDVSADVMPPRPGPQRQSSSASIQRPSSSRDVTPMETSVPRFRPERQSSRGSLEAPSVTRPPNCDAPAPALSATAGFQRQLGRDTPTDSVATPTRVQQLTARSTSSSSFFPTAGLQNQSIFDSTTSLPRSDAKTSLFRDERQPDEAVILTAEAMDCNATKQQLQLAMSRVAEQAQEISELRSHASKVEELKAESREAVRELEQVRMQLSSAASDKSTALESELRCAHETRALQTAEIEELRSLQNSSAPLSELRQIQEECAQLVAERELIQKHVDKQQAKWDETLQSNRDEVASMLQAFEREQTTKVALASELEVATEHARRAEQAQYSMKLEGLQELEVHRSMADQEKEVSMVEMQAHLQHLAERQAAIDGLSRERMLALEDISRMEAESARVAAQTECAQQQAEERKTKKAKMKRSSETDRHEVASLMQSLEAERAKHTRLAEELKFSLEKVSRAEQEHRCMHARREEALQEREANEAEKHEEMQAFVMQLAARQAAIDDLSRERSAALEQVFQIEAASTRVTARTKSLQRGVDMQQASLSQDADASLENGEQTPLARQLHAALEQIQLSQERDSSGGQDFLSDSAQNLMRRLEAEEATTATLVQELRAASEQVAQAEQERNALLGDREQAFEELRSEMDKMAREREATAVELQDHAKQVAQQRSEKGCFNKDQAAALESMSSVQARCAQIAAERDRVQREFNQQKAEMNRAIDSGFDQQALALQAQSDEVGSLASCLQAEKAEKAALVQQLDAAAEQTFRAEQERERIRAERREALEELQDDRAKMAQQREAHAAEVRLHASQLAEQKSALDRERAAALEEVSKVEARCAQATAERDRIERELLQQKAGMVKDKNDGEDTDAPEGQATKSSWVQQVDSALQQALRAQQERDRVQAEREQALLELQDQRAHLSFEREAKLAEMQAYAKQVEVNRLAADGFEKERAAALEQVTKAEAQCLQAAKERDRLQSEFSQEQARKTNDVEAMRDEAASLAKSLAAEKAARASLAEKLDAAIEQTRRAERDRDTARADREQELKVQGALKKERTAALERASEAEAKYAEAAAESQRTKRDAAQEQAKIASASESQRDEVAALSKRLEAEQAAKASLARQLDEAMQQTSRIKQERDKIQAEREEVLKEFQSHRAQMAREREASVADVQAHVQQMIEQQSTKESLSRERAAAMEQASNAEAKCAQMTAEKDRLKREIAEQQSKMTSLSQRLEAKEQATSVEASRVQVSARMQQGSGESRTKTAQSYDARKGEIQSLVKRLEEEKASRETLSKDFEANLQRLETKLYDPSDPQSVRPNLEARDSSTARSARTKAGPPSVSVMTAVVTAAAASRNDQQSGKPSLVSKGAADLLSPSKDGQQPGSIFHTALGVLSKSPGSPSQNDLQSSKTEASSRGEESPGRTFQSALQALSSPQSRSMSDLLSPSKDAPQSRSMSDVLSPSKDASPSELQPGKTYQSALLALSNAPSRSASESPSKATGSQSDLLSPSRDPSRQRDASPGKTFQFVLKALSQPASRSSSVHSQSPCVEIGSQGDPPSPGKEASSQGDPQSGSTFQNALKALSKVGSRDLVNPPQSAFQDLSTGTRSHSDSLSRRTSQVSTITPGTPPQRRSAEPFSWPRKDLQSAGPPPSSKGFSQSDSRTASGAPSTRLGSVSGPSSRSGSQDKPSSGSSLRGLAQTRANIQKLHERLNISGPAPAPILPVSTSNQDQTLTEGARDLLNQVSYKYKTGESPTSPESPKTDSASSPDKRSVNSAGSDERRSRKVRLEQSESILGIAESLAGDQKLEMPPLALEGLRKASDSLSPEGRSINNPITSSATRFGAVDSTDLTDFGSAQSESDCTVNSQAWTR